MTAEENLPWFAKVGKEKSLLFPSYAGLSGGRQNFPLPYWVGSGGLCGLGENPGLCDWEGSQSTSQAWDVIHP